MSPEDRKMFARKAPVQVMDDRHDAQPQRRTFEARPVQGTIDYDAYLADVKQRFGKALAYLAK